MDNTDTFIKEPESEDYLSVTLVLEAKLDAKSGAKLSAVEYC